MTPISKILSLLLTVLLVTSLFIPAVAANCENGGKNGLQTSQTCQISQIEAKEALWIRVDTGHLSALTREGVGYQYNRTEYIRSEDAKQPGEEIYWKTQFWDIHTTKGDFFTFCADNDEKRMKLLEFMCVIDDEYQKEEADRNIAKFTVLAGSLLVVGGILCIVIMDVPKGLTIVTAGAGLIATGAVILIYGMDDDVQKTTHLRNLAKTLQSPN